MHSDSAYFYSSSLTTAEASLSEWRFISHVHCDSVVVADGCRDLIVCENDRGDVDWFISHRSDSSYRVSSDAGVRMRGLRLLPGVSLCTDQLARWLQSNSIESVFIGDQIDEFCVRPADLLSALDCLASGVPDVRTAAHELGYSVRTLQRLVKAGTGNSPHAWLSLARARKAARSLINYPQLGEAAIACGYADQAHMSREMRKWFGESPQRLKNNTELNALLREPGFG